MPGKYILEGLFFRPIKKRLFFKKKRYMGQLVIIKITYAPNHSSDR